MKLKNLCDRLSKPPEMPTAATSDWQSYASVVRHFVETNLPVHAGWEFDREERAFYWTTSTHVPIGGKSHEVISTWKWDPTDDPTEQLARIKSEMTRIRHSFQALEGADDQARIRPIR